MNYELHKLIVEACEEHGYRKTERESGVPKTILIRWSKRNPKSQGDYRGSDQDWDYATALVDFLNDNLADEGEDVSMERSESGDMKISGTIGGRVMRYDEVFHKFGLSSDEWKVKKLVCKPYTTSMKLRVVEEHKDGSKTISDRPHSHQGYSINVTLEPREDAINRIKALDNLIEILEARQPPVFKRAPANNGRPVMPIIAIPDLHLGKLAAHGGWSIDEAVAKHDEALDYLVNDVDDLNIDHFVYLMGNDLMQVDSPAGTTTSGTLVARNDSWENMYDAACDLSNETVRKLLQRAPVKMKVIRGNHDRTSTYGVAKVVQAFWRGNSDVEVDITHDEGSAITFGNNFILGLHGDRANAMRNAMSLAISYPDEWAQSKDGSREILHGHLHKSKAKQWYSQYDDELGAITRWLSALCPPDHWHLYNRFVGALKSAQALSYDKEMGLCRMSQFNNGR